MCQHVLVSHKWCGHQSSHMVCEFQATAGEEPRFRPDCPAKKPDVNHVEETRCPECDLLPGTGLTQGLKNIQLYRQTKKYHTAHANKSKHKKTAAQEQKEPKTNAEAAEVGAAKAEALRAEAMASAEMMSRKHEELMGFAFTNGPDAAMPEGILQSTWKQMKQELSPEPQGPPSSSEAMSVFEKAQKRRVEQFPHMPSVDQVMEDISKLDQIMKDLSKSSSERRQGATQNMQQQYGSAPESLDDLMPTFSETEGADYREEDFLQQLEINPTLQRDLFSPDPEFLQEYLTEQQKQFQSELDFPHSKSTKQKSQGSLQQPKLLQRNFQPGKNISSCSLDDVYLPPFEEEETMGRKLIEPVSLPQKPSEQERLSQDLPSLEVFMSDLPLPDASLDEMMCDPVASNEPASSPDQHQRRRAPTAATLSADHPKRPKTSSSKRSATTSDDPRSKRSKGKGRAS